MLGIGWKVGASLAGDCPAGPGSPFALLAAGLAEAVGVVLEVDARVADEGVAWCVFYYIEERQVGERVLGEDGFVAMQVGSPCSIEAENGSGGEMFAPELLGVLEAGQVESFASAGFLKLIERAPVHAFWWLGQPWNVG